MKECILELENDHPKLREVWYERTSPCTDEYNCLAFAAGDLCHWWEPGCLPPYYWPLIQHDLTVPSFIEAFKTIGFSVVPDATPQPGMEIVAVFVDENDQVSHAAIQEEDGLWKSKCGDRFDIRHSLDDLNFGKLKLFLTRPRIIRQLPDYDESEECPYHLELQKRDAGPEWRKAEF